MVATLALIIVLCPVALTPGVGGFLFRPLTWPWRSPCSRRSSCRGRSCRRCARSCSRGHGHARPRHDGSRPRPRTAAASSTALYGADQRRSSTSSAASYAALLAVGAAATGFLVLLGIGLLFVASLRAGPVHRPGVLPGRGRRADHDPGSRPVATCGSTPPSGGSSTWRRLIAEVDPAARAADDRLGDRAQQRLVGGLLRQRRPAGHGHPPATDAGANELGPGIRRPAAARSSPPTRSSPTWNSASTPAGWSRPRSISGPRRRSTFKYRGGTPDQKFEVGRQDSETGRGRSRGGRRAGPSAERRAVPDPRGEPGEGASGRAVGQAMS